MDFAQGREQILQHGHIGCRVAEEDNLLEVVTPLLLPDMVTSPAAARYQHTGYMIMMVAELHEHDFRICDELYKVTLQVKLHQCATEQFFSVHSL